MRRWRAIVLTTAREILSEPLVLLVTLTAMALSALAPAVHYHQFGDPTRMARDAGLSMLLVSGLVVGTFGAIRTVRREIETGTALLALAHSVSRSAFFLSKVAGVALALAAVSVAIASVTLTTVNATAIAAESGVRIGRLAAIWGPSLALVVAAVTVPLVAAAVLNRAFRFRFTPTAFMLAFALAVGGTAYRFDAALAGRLLPVLAVAALPALVPLAAAAAFATRFRANAAAALTALAAAAFLPALGAYCLGDALTDGGRIPAGYPPLALAAIAPPVALLLLAGCRLFGGKDIS